MLFFSIYPPLTLSFFFTCEAMNCTALAISHKVWLEIFADHRFLCFVEVDFHKFGFLTLPLQKKFHGFGQFSP